MFPGDVMREHWPEMGQKRLQPTVLKNPSHFMKYYLTHLFLMYPFSTLGINGLKYREKYFILYL